MAVAPSTKTIKVPAKKLLKDDTLKFVATSDGRVVIESVKRGLPKELVPGMVVTAIRSEPSKPAGKKEPSANNNSDTEDDEAASVTAVDAAISLRKAAAKAGGTVVIQLDGAVSTAVKPKKDAKIGVSLRKDPERDVMIITKVAETSIFFGKTKLEAGQILTRINGKPCPSTAAEAVAVLKAAKKGPLTLVTIPDAVAVAAAAPAEEDFLEEDQPEQQPAEEAEDEEQENEDDDQQPASDANNQDAAPTTTEDVANDADDNEPKDAPEDEDVAPEENNTSHRMEDVDLDETRSTAAASVERSDDFDREIAAHQEAARKGADDLQSQHQQEDDKVPTTGWLCCAY